MDTADGQCQMWSVCICVFLWHVGGGGHSLKYITQLGPTEIKQGIFTPVNLRASRHHLHQDHPRSDEV